MSLSACSSFSDVTFDEQGLFVTGGDALISCGMMESLLRVVNWRDEGQEHITVGGASSRIP